MTPRHLGTSAPSSDLFADAAGHDSLCLQVKALFDQLRAKSPDARSPLELSLLAHAVDDQDWQRQKDAEAALKARAERLAREGATVDAGEARSAWAAGLERIRQELRAVPATAAGEVVAACKLEAGLLIHVRTVVERVMDTALGRLAAVGGAAKAEAA